MGGCALYTGKKLITLNMKPTYFLIKLTFFISLALLLSACEKIDSSSLTSTFKKTTVIYKVQGPNGRIYEIEGPPNASEAQVINFLKSIIEPSSSTNYLPPMVDLTINGEPVPCSVHPNLLKDVFPNRISISCP